MLVEGFEVWADTRRTPVTDDYLALLYIIAGWELSLSLGRSARFRTSRDEAERPRSRRRGRGPTSRHERGPATDWATRPSARPRGQGRGVVQCSPSRSPAGPVPPGPSRC